MTSKNSFFRLLMEDLKRRIWTIGLACLAFFVFFPLYCTILATQEVSKGSRYRIIEKLVELMGTNYFGIILITMLGAVICGLSGFFYLHSRKKVDLFHSIPVRREYLFSVNYINGLLIYLLPYIFNVFLCFIVLGITGYMDGEILLSALSGISISFLFYCIIYTITIIAVMLTGNIIVSCLGTAVFLVYGSIISGIKMLTFDQFFDTYFMGLEYKPLFFDIIQIYIDTVMKQPYSAIRIILLIITIAILIGFSVFLYIKRPSEAAGKAMTFGPSKAIIKFFIVIPTSILGGSMFMDFCGDSIVWFVFGTAFLLLISCAIIEIIYNFDIKKVFNHKKQMLGCAVAVAIISITLIFDLFNYDSYIPKKNKVESMSVSLSGLDQCLCYYDMESTKYYHVIDGVDYHMKYMKLKDFEAAYKLVELGVKDPKDKEQAFRYCVKYKLKSGKDVYRAYYLSLNQCYDLVKEVFENEEFKKIHYPILNSQTKGITYVHCNNILKDKMLDLDVSEREQIIKIYNEELLRLTFDEKMNNEAVADIDFVFLESGLNYSNCLIYPSFVKTIAFLQAHGFDTERKLEAKDIREIEIEDKQNADIRVKYLDKEKIRNLLPYLERDNEDKYILEKHESVDICIKPFNDQNGDSFSFVFKDKMPKFVQEDLKKSNK